MNTRIKELRRILKLTQDKFAKSINISRSTFSAIENGTINITDRNIKMICSTHNVSEEWIRTGEGEMFDPSNEDDELDILIGAFYAENDEFKKKVIKTMLSWNDEDWLFMKKFVNEIKD